MIKTSTCLFIAAALFTAVYCFFSVNLGAVYTQKSRPVDKLISSTKPAPFVKTDQATIAEEIKSTRTNGRSLPADVWEAATQALRTADASTLYDVSADVAECNGLGAQWDLFTNFASGASTPISGLLTPERQMAIDYLQRRCHRFLTASADEKSHLTKSLSERRTAIGGDMMKDFKRLNDGDVEGFKSLIASNSVVAREDALRKFSDFWAQANPAIATETNTRLVNMGAFLAPCDLGKDCSATSYASQLLCATSGQCGTTLWSNWKEDFSVDQANEILKYKESIVKAVRLNDFSSFNIKP